MYTIKETLAELENEKTEIENKIELVKSFDKLTTADFTEEVYHDFCKTTLRGGDILGEKLASVFPFLVLQKGRSNYNEYAFDFKDLKDNKYFIIKFLFIVLKKIVDRSKPFAKTFTTPFYTLKKRIS